MSAATTDWVARTIAIAGVVIALAGLAFNIWKEWWRGKRLRVGLEQTRDGAASQLVVNAYNAGNTPLTVTDWGFRVSGPGGRGRVVPTNTGQEGPTLPVTLDGSSPLPPLSMASTALVAAARSQLQLRADGTIKVRAYVRRDGDKRVFSRRRSALRLPL